MMPSPSAPMKDIRPLLSHFDQVLATLEREPESHYPIFRMCRILQSLKMTAAGCDQPEIIISIMNTQYAFEMVRDGELAVSPPLLATSRELRDLCQAYAEAKPGEC